MARFLKKLLSNKTDDDGDSYTSAHLGEENTFYYNEELKQWVMKGEEDKVKESLETPPPPMPPMDLSPQSQGPPAPHMDVNGGVGLNTESSEHRVKSPLHTTGRRMMKSSQLYTNIPGMNVTQEKPLIQSFLNIPNTSVSQFVPSNEIDPSMLDDAYRDFLNPKSSNPPEETPAEETETKPE